MPIGLYLYSSLFLLVMSCEDHKKIPLPEGCIQPPSTGILIYDMSDTKHIGTQVTPAGECECPSDPTNKIVFFNPVADNKPTTGDKAGASTINMHCRKKEDVCVCDENDVCWKLENAYAEVVINAFCDPGSF